MFAHKNFLGDDLLPECALFRVPLYKCVHAISSVWKNNQGTIQLIFVVSAKQNDPFLHFWTFFMAI